MYSYLTKRQENILGRIWDEAWEVMSMEMERIRTETRPTWEAFILAELRDRRDSGEDLSVREMVTLAVDKWTQVHAETDHAVEAFVARVERGVLEAGIPLAATWTGDLRQIISVHQERRRSFRHSLLEGDALDGQA